MPHTYSFLNTLASISGPGGNIPLGASSGAAEEGISVTPEGEIDAMTIGADGSGMHSLIANKAAKITIRLLKTSPTNALLSAMVAFQRTNAASHGQNTISIVNDALGDVITAQQVAFAKIPDISYAKEGGIVEWEFNVVDCDIALGAGPGI